MFWRENLSWIAGNEKNQSLAKLVLWQTISNWIQLLGRFGPMINKSHKQNLLAVRYIRSNPF